MFQCIFRKIKGIEMIKTIITRSNNNCKLFVVS
jgi:hypothetical protein